MAVAALKAVRETRVSSKKAKGDAVMVAVVLIILIYLAICGGLLEQVERSEELSRAKRFILLVPLLHIYFLVKACVVYAMTRNPEYKRLIKAYFPYKAVLILILFSIAEVEKEMDGERKRDRKKLKSISIRDWFSHADMEFSNNLKKQCI